MPEVTAAAAALLPQVIHNIPQYSDAAGVSAATLLGLTDAR